MDKLFIETVTFGMGHSLIMGHKPENITMDQIYRKMEEDEHDIESFGLFERATPNYTTYYPDVTAEDLAPQDAEFIEPIFRMLSNVTVYAGWNPIYFPADVLKSSMYLLLGSTVNIDHEMAVGNAIGSVKSVEWQNSYTASGVKVPAGINAVLKIDGKANPRIARGIMMDPPSIHANSVTVKFGWKKSHPKLSDEDFFQKIGTFDDKGKLIQKIAEKIEAYHETSLVSHGADPFAQKVDANGKIVKPIYAGSRYNLADQTIDKDSISNNYIYVDFKQFKDYDPESGVITITSTGTNIPNQNTENMEAFLRFLETLHNLEVDSLTEENYQEKLKDIETGHATALSEATEEPEPVVILELEGVEAIEGEITSLREKLAAVPEDVSEKIELAETGKVVVSELRAETERLYKLTAEEGKPDAAILAVIAGSDYKTLKALHKQYEEAAGEAFKMTCDDCGSENVTRASAQPGAEGEDEKKPLSNEEIMDKHTGVHESKLSPYIKSQE